MEFKSIDHWDERLWNRVKTVYTEAFGDKGAKSEKIIKNMFAQELCVLHVLFDDSKVAAMAITGAVKDSRSLLIDYLAVDEEYRNHGAGQKLVEYLIEWSLIEKHYDRIIIEVEYDECKMYDGLVLFWGKSGFTLTDYIHHYRWVAEKYRAMYLVLNDNKDQSIEGEEIFKEIVTFHRLSFRGK